MHNQRQKFQAYIGEEKLHVSYLGGPLTSYYLHVSYCTLMLNEISSRLEGWDSSLLSSMGKVEFIQRTITLIIMYRILIYHIPTIVLNTVDKMCADFFWHGKLHKISWDMLCRPKKERGVGLRKFSDLNTPARIKLVWNLITNDCLWSRWMKAK